MVNSEADVREVLEQRLSRVRRMFDITALTSHRINTTDVVDYYRQSALGYRLLHSARGSIHMALNFDGIFDKDGYWNQARTVAKKLRETPAERVLELASGRGFNLEFLCEELPEVSFYGLDLTRDHVKTAGAKLRRLGLSNRLCVADFQRLPFADESFDHVFVIESLCHSPDLRLAFEEVHRVSRSGAYFTVFDGYRTPGFDELPESVRAASRLVEASMAIIQGWKIDEWTKVAAEQGFAVIETEDLSHAIQPNLARFERWATRFFERRRKHVLSRVLPSALMHNAVAGYLMPLTIAAGAHNYSCVMLNRV